MNLYSEDLEKLLEEARDVSYSEARYHRRSQNEIRISRGELDEARSIVYRGVGIRVLADGGWGFSSTSDLSQESLRRSLKNAIAIAKVSSSNRKEKKVTLADGRLATGKFSPPIDDPLTNHALEEKIALVRDVESRARSYSTIIRSALSSYSEILDEKIIVTSDGADAQILDSKVEFRVAAVASGEGDTVSASETLGVTGGWRDLFRRKDPFKMAEKAAETAERLLSAKQPKGEKATVVLDPAMVGLISHEAIGHTVEADFVLSGSIAKGKIGEKVGSELITLVDSGPSQIIGGAGGTVLVDDEGVLAQKTVIIEDGVLISYLHNRETAALFEVESTGNARAFEYSDEPIIRMRNTYIEPGDYSFDEMVEDIGHGYLLKGARGGQADANGEFMFGAQEAYLIDRGEVKELLRGVSVSGRAFETLMTVDAITKEFSYEIGAGYCGKWQLAKVDGGGGYLRCKATIGGMQ